MTLIEVYTFMSSFFSVPSAAPQNLTVTVVNSRTFVLYWIPPPPETQNGVIRQYRLSVFVRETREPYLLFLEDTQFVFDVAHPFYTYTFTVAAETIGTGPYGEEITITAPEDGRTYTIHAYIIQTFKYFIFY